MRPTVTEILQNINKIFENVFAPNIDTKGDMRVLVELVLFPKCIEYIQKRWEYQAQLYIEENTSLQKILTITLEGIKDITEKSPHKDLQRLGEKVETTLGSQYEGKQNQFCTEHLREENTALRTVLEDVIISLDQETPKEKSVVC